MRKLIFSLIVGFFITSLAATTFAMPILEGSSSDGGTTWFSEFDADSRSAKAIFTSTNTGFEISLYNTYLGTDKMVPNKVLLGLFFGLSGVAENPDVIGTIENTSGIITGDYLNGEWAFLSGINGINGGLGNYGISASSFDPCDTTDPECVAAPTGWDGFGAGSVIDPSQNYPGSSVAVGGADFGIVGINSNNFTAAVDPFVREMVTISFDGDPGTIEQVHFLYGTEYIGETPIPEPGTLLLLGAGLMGVAAFGRKKFKK